MFSKIGVRYFGVLFTRILLVRVLSSGPLFLETPIRLKSLKGFGSTGFEISLIISKPKPCTLNQRKPCFKGCAQRRKPGSRFRASASVSAILRRWAQPQIMGRRREGDTPDLPPKKPKTSKPRKRNSKPSTPGPKPDTLLESQRIRVGAARSRVKKPFRAVLHLEAPRQSVHQPFELRNLYL